MDKETLQAIREMRAAGRLWDEIARTLGVSLAKVKTDILRGRAALAQLLVRSGAPHEAFQP